MNASEKMANENDASHAAAGRLANENRQINISVWVGISSASLLAFENTRIRSCERGKKI